MGAEVVVPDAAVGAGWHELRYPRPATDEPSESFRRALAAAAPLIVAAELERLAEQWRPLREEMRDVDDRNVRSSALGIAISDVERRATELRGEGWLMVEANDSEIHDTLDGLNWERIAHRVSLQTGVTVTADEVRRMAHAEIWKLGNA